MSGVGGGGLAAPLIPLRHCKGGCDRRLPETTEHWFFREGRINGHCRECRARLKTQHDGPWGLVPAHKVYPLMVELVERCGSMEKAAKASGISPTGIRDVIQRRRPNVQKRIVRLLVLALHERRKQDRKNGNSARFQEARKEQARREEKMNRLAGY